MVPKTATNVIAKPRNAHFCALFGLFPVFFFVFKKFKLIPRYI